MCSYRERIKQIEGVRGGKCYRRVEAAAQLIQVAGPYSLQRQLSVEALRIRQARVMTPVRVERL